MATNDLEYYINLVNKAAGGFEALASNFEKCSIVRKMLSNSISCYKEIFRDRVKIATATPTFNHHHLISQQPSTLRQDSTLAKQLELTEGSDDSLLEAQVGLSLKNGEGALAAR
ncbi:Tigger transposable element-derived protein 1 [Plecturocebus cupreus]